MRYAYESLNLMPHTSCAHPFEFNGVVRLTKVGTTYLVSTVVLGHRRAEHRQQRALHRRRVHARVRCCCPGIASKGGLKHLHVEVAASTTRGPDGRRTARCACATTRASGTCATCAHVRRDSRSRCSSRCCRGGSDDRGRGVVPLHAARARARCRRDRFVHALSVRLLSQEAPRADVTATSWSIRASSPRTRRASGSARSRASRARRTGRARGREIHSFREYVRGDSLRHVHWKKSASLGRWIMKQTDAEAGAVGARRRRSVQAARRSSDETSRR